MRESDLYPPVRDWLIGRGYEIHVELFGCDIVAVKNGVLVAVELKVSFTNRLVCQLRSRRPWADFVIAATAGKINGPHRLDFRNGLMQVEGYGLICVDGRHAAMLIKPRRQKDCKPSRQKYRLKILAGRAPAMEHELAGLPACSQLREQRLIRAAQLKGQRQ